MTLTVEGVYRQGKVELLEIPQGMREGRVRVTLTQEEAAPAPRYLTRGKYKASACLLWRTSKTRSGAVKRSSTNSMSDEFVVDAHTLIWYIEDNPRLGANAGRVMDDPASVLWTLFKNLQ